ncbi:hypothetical protein DL93DRAFT_1090820 [Clavulina sp. PMI_390]|nr:hypothetical protein DL93DRAFT_1090820 [Clavulina sp. PMI_390]
MAVILPVRVSIDGIGRLGVRSSEGTLFKSGRWAPQICQPIKNADGVTWELSIFPKITIVNPERRSPSTYKTLLFSRGMSHVEQKRCLVSIIPTASAPCTSLLAFSLKTSIHRTENPIGIFLLCAQYTCDDPDSHSQLPTLTITIHVRQQITKRGSLPRCEARRCWFLASFLRERHRHFSPASSISTILRLGAVA